MMKKATHMGELHNRQSGAVSLITVIFIAILLTILTLGFIRMTIHEQRQSTDDDLSARAYYAAEAGVDDARRDIRLYTQGALTEADLNTDDCGPSLNSNPDLSADTDLAASYTCQLIQLDVESYQAFVAKGESIQIPLIAKDASGAVVPFDNVEVSWHITATDLDDGAFTLRNASDTWWLSEANWGGNQFPAALRTNFFSFAPGAGRANVIANNFVGFLNPINGGAGSRALGALPAGPIVDANCQQITGTYACTQLISGFNNGRTHYLRLKPLYRDTHVEIRLSNGPNGAVDLFMANAQAIIDVTGRAGDVFRRIETRVPLSDLTDWNILPDFSIESAEDVCKNFVVTDNPGEFDTYNPNVENNTTCDPT